MRRTSLSPLIFVLLVGACGDDGPSVARLEDMRVVKISGDQSSQVPSAPSATIYATAGAALNVIGPDGYTSEPLVARVEVVGANGITDGGPIVPAGTLIQWNLPVEAGRLFDRAIATDDSAYVINRWAPGTKAGTYEVYVGRLVSSDILTLDAKWELVVEPGAPVEAAWGGAWQHDAVAAGDTIDLA